MHTLEACGIVCLSEIICTAAISSITVMSQMPENLSRMLFFGKLLACIQNVKVKIKLTEAVIKQMKVHESIKTLGANVKPQLNWDV